jgi:glyceraldehyde-3-phosphate dehydrogenase (NADP+)
MTNNSKTFESLFLVEKTKEIPYFEMNQFLVNGKLRTWSGKTASVVSPIWKQSSPNPTKIGIYPMLTKKEALDALESARNAFNNGQGEWPLLSVKKRIETIEAFIHEVKKVKDQIVALLMWEICKTQEDAQKEVDRTIKYIYDTIQALKDLENRQSTFTIDSGYIAQIRRAPLGVVVCLGPFNYPFNETYATLIPALIMGNTVIMKLPRVGILCHLPTLSIFEKIFPPGVVNIISGSGRETMPPILESGKVDVLAFIGTSQAADALQKAHPKPHRLRICLGLEAKNAAIILPDADIQNAVEECTLGSLNYNGQRCTAIKIIMVHEKVAETFIDQFITAVDTLKMGLPWEKDVKITPLPEEGKPGYLQELTIDALNKGSKIINKLGGKIDRSFVAPAIFFPVTSEMRLYHEEQFGPLVPITTFTDIKEIFSYMSQSPYGQQVALFSRNPETIAPLLDVLVNQVSRVNINTQCRRGPDTFPFTARKDSAYGTLSVSDALRVFSLRALVTTQEKEINEEILRTIISQRKSNFLRTDYLF